MTIPYVAPRLRRTLAAVFRFYDVFLGPFDDATPLISSPLDVSIPELNWRALQSDNDRTYRFSARTLTQSTPGGANLGVKVVAARGDYVNFEPILLTLPLPISTPPVRADFLITRPLWPTPAARPPAGETAIWGHISGSAVLPVADLKVQAWLGSTPTPPAGTLWTRSDANGDFLFRFPLLKGAPGHTASISIQLADGAIAVTPNSLSIVLGQTQIVELQRT
jgi:hypothetical protein